METDGDGFLMNRDDWSEEIMVELSKKDGFELTEEHIKSIRSAPQVLEDEGTVPA